MTDEILTDSVGVDRCSFREQGFGRVADADRQVVVVDKARRIAAVGFAS